MELIYLKNGAEIYVPVEVTGEKGVTIFTAAHRNPPTHLFWRLDNHYVGSTFQFRQMSFNLSPANMLLHLGMNKEKLTAEALNSG